MKKELIKFFAYGAIVVAALFVSYSKGYNQREKEFQAWLSIEHQKEMARQMAQADQLREVMENAIIKQKEDGAYISAITDDNHRMQQQATELQTKLSSTTKDAEALKELAATTAKILAKCEARASKITTDYRDNERITVEFKERLSIYEQ